MSVATASPRTAPPVNNHDTTDSILYVLTNESPKLRNSDRPTATEGPTSNASSKMFSSVRDFLPLSPDSSRRSAAS